jgi:circadian clock protein KaiC
VTSLRLHLERTGDHRFDTILGGGIPAQSVVVIAGEPGSGKTVLTLQLLFEAARQGKTCLYVTTLSEPAIKLIRYMQFFDFFDPDVLDSRIRLADLGAAVRDGAERTLADLASLVQKYEPGIVAIDSFKSIGDLMPNSGVARSFVYELATQTATWGATTLLLGEYGPEDLSRRPEFAVADGILQLGAHRRELTALRELEILKLRGMGYVSGRHFFEIDRRGFFVYPRVRSPQETAAKPPVPDRPRLPTGTKGLDALIGGGIPALSSTVLQGPTGSGKTLLGLQFLIEGARLGERGAICTLEETPDQLRAVARTLGWDLPALEKKGLLVIDYCSPVELSTDRYLQSVRDLVTKNGISRVVFDSLTSMSLGVHSDRRFKELVYAMSKHMRAAGVSLVMTVESTQLLGGPEIGARGVSFIADNLIQLRYLEVASRLERGLSVLKARGVKHETGLRRLHVERGGLRLSGVGRGARHRVLTGHGRDRRRTPRRTAR